MCAFNNTECTMKPKLHYLPAIALLFAPLLAENTANAASAPRACTNTAIYLHRACSYEAADDLQIAAAICTNSANGATCLRDARADYNTRIQECSGFREERDDVCDAVGEAPYAPAFGPAFAANFVDPNKIGHGVAPNPFLPLVAGNTWTYKKNVLDDEGQPEVETIHVVVTDATKLVDGVTCRVVRDTVMSGDNLKEDTSDWFAQDSRGNVWYCGEEVKDYESFEADRPELPELVSRDGSFKAGRDGDKPGIIMLAAPRVGVTYREEASWNNAEDLSEVISITGSDSTPAASCRGTCLVLRAFSPLSPDGDEIKYYAPGVGEISNTKEETGVRAQLVEFTHR